MVNNRRCEICIIDVHRASMQKRLISRKKHLENEKQNEMIITEWLLEEEQAPIKNKIKKTYNPTTLKQIARENAKINDKELQNELVKKMNNPW